MKTCTWKRALLAAAALALTVALPLSAANVSVPLLELYTWGHDDGGGWGLASTGQIELRLDGGYKFGASVLFGFDSAALENAGALGDTFLFRAASVTLRELLGLPLDLTYFIGQGPTFGSGEVFTDFFGAAPMGSTYTGFIHFPDAVTKARGTYEGIHTPTGTGLQCDFSRLRDRWLLSVLLYQDSLIDATPGAGTGNYSLDVRYALNLPKLLFEGFVGATYPDASDNFGAYRAGLLFFTAPAKGVEIFAAVGIPQWDPVADPFSLDLFYALLEPRLRFKMLSIVQTTLWRPAYYQQVATGERAIDVNLDVQLGNVEKLLSGGIEGNLVYQTDPPLPDDIVVKVSPYVRLSTSGVVFETRLSGRLYPFDFGGDMFEVFVGVKAEF